MNQVLMLFDISNISGQIINLLRLPMFEYRISEAELEELFDYVIKKGVVDLFNDNSYPYNTHTLNGEHRRDLYLCVYDSIRVEVANLLFTVLEHYLHKPLPVKLKILVTVRDLVICKSNYRI
jgi:hypothetical protein